MSSQKHTFNILEDYFSPRFLAEGRRDTQRVLFLILPATLYIYYTFHLYIYIYILINIGLGHLGWEILPGRSCLGPYGPRQDLPGKISQPRCPSPIFITTLVYPGCADRSVSSSEYRRTEYDEKLP